MRAVAAPSTRSAGSNRSSKDLPLISISGLRAGAASRGYSWIGFSLMNPFRRVMELAGAVQPDASAGCQTRIASPLRADSRLLTDLRIDTASPALALKLGRWPQRQFRECAATSLPLATTFQVPLILFRHTAALRIVVGLTAMTSANSAIIDADRPHHRADRPF